MTGVPDYVSPTSPAAQAVHNAPPLSDQWRNLTQEQINNLRARLIESLIQIVVQAITGAFAPGNLGAAFAQLQQWAEAIQADIADVPLLGDLVEIFTGVEDGDLTDLGTWVNNLLRNFDGFQFGQPILEQLSGLVQSLITGFFTWIQSLLNPLGFGVTPTEFTAWLNSLPSWSDLVAQLTGIPFGDSSDLQTWADQINRNQREFWNRIVEAMDFDHDGDVDLQDVITAIQQIPSSIVTGTGGPSTNADTWQQFWDGLWEAFTGLTATGKSMADVNSVAGAVSSSVANHEATLGLRDNKPIFYGLEETMIANGSHQDLTGYLALHNVANWGLIRVPEKTTFSNVTWLGYNTASIDLIRIDVAFMARTAAVGTDVGDFFFDWSFRPDFTGGAAIQSGNLVSGTSDALAWNTWDFDGEIPCEAGDVLAVRFLVEGTGTYYIGKPTTAVTPPNPAVVPRATGVYDGFSTSVSGHVLLSTIDAGVSAGWFNGGAPWFGLSSGAVTYHTPILREFPASDTCEIEPWVQFIDVIACSSGGGGRSSDPFGGDGEGGHAGNWGTATLQRDVHFHIDTTAIDVIVGAVGAGGPYINGVGSQPGGTGGVSGVQYFNTSSVLTTTLNPSGGAGGTILNPFQSFTGGSPGNIDYAGRRFYGGSAQNNSGYAGNPAGGGGAGGHNFGIQSGGDGAPGVVWLNLRQS